MKVGGGLPLRLADVRLEWDWVRVGVARVKARFSAEWRPEDVYGACLAEWAFLFVPAEGPFVNRAFVVLQPRVCEYTRAKHLHVWLAWSELTGAVESFLPAIEQIARETGHVRLIWRSPREGWTRHDPRFVRLMVEYAMEVSS